MQETPDAPEAMPVSMAPDEIEFFHACLGGVRRYFEYGVGGSTIAVWQQCLAAGIVPEIHGVDTSLSWINSVADALGNPETVRLEHVDVGPVADWGFPINKTPNEPVWTSYPKAIHRCGNPATLDMVLIDGRFRVACAIQTILACSSTTKILMHDYNNRPEYHVIEIWLDKVESVGTLALFSKRDLLPEDLIALEVAFRHYWKRLG